MLYALSEDEYNEVYGQFCKEAPKNVRDYYDTNWHKIREELVRHYFTECNFKNDTNNRIESLNQKFKLFIEKSSYFTDFLIKIFEFLQVHKNERDDKAVKMISRMPLYDLSDD